MNFITQIEIKSGTETVIRVKPVKHVASDKFKAVRKKKRFCRFPNEQSRPSMFKRYSQSGCLFECRLKYAIVKAGCIPWDYPVPSGIDERAYPMCTFGDVKENVVNSTSNLN